MDRCDLPTASAGSEVGWWYGSVRDKSEKAGFRRTKSQVFIYIYIYIYIYRERERERIGLYTSSGTRCPSVYPLCKGFILLYSRERERAREPERERERAGELERESDRTGARERQIK